MRISPLTHLINIRVSEKLYDKLRAQAKKHHITVAVLVRNILEQYYSKGDINYEHEKTYKYNLL